MDHAFQYHVHVTSHSMTWFLASKFMLQVPLSDKDWIFLNLNCSHLHNFRQHLLLLCKIVQKLVCSWVAPNYVSSFSVTSIKYPGYSPWDDWCCCGRSVVGNLDHWAYIDHFWDYQLFLTSLLQSEYHSQSSDRNFNRWPDVAIFYIVPHLKIIKETLLGGFVSRHALFMVGTVQNFHGWVEYMILKLWGRFQLQLLLSSKFRHHKVLQILKFHTLNVLQRSRCALPLISWHQHFCFNFQHGSQRGSVSHFSSSYIPWKEQSWALWLPPILSLPSC